MRPRYVLTSLLVVFVLGAAVLYTVPGDDFLFTPDRAKPLVEKVRVEGAKPVGSGDVYYVDVFVRRTTLLEELLPFTRPDGSDLVPEEALLPPGTTEEERDRENALAMQQSELVASAVALRALGYDVDVTPTGGRVVGVATDVPASSKLETGDVIVAADGRRIKTTDDLRREVGRRQPGDAVRLTVLRDGERVQLSVKTVPSPDDASRPIIGIEVEQRADIELPIEVDIDLGQVGGPSAGLPFALEIARLLGQNLTNGCNVAATGELALDGTVLPVGGLTQKTLGARRAAVDVFVVPAGTNASDAREHAGDLPVIAVDSFQQALRKLATARLNC